MIAVFSLHFRPSDAKLSLVGGNPLRSLRTGADVRASTGGRSPKSIRCLDRVAGCRLHSVSASFGLRKNARWLVPAGAIYCEIEFWISRSEAY